MRKTLLNLKYLLWAVAYFAILIMPQGIDRVVCWTIFLVVTVYMANELNRWVFKKAYQRRKK